MPALMALDTEIVAFCFEVIATSLLAMEMNCKIEQIHRLVLTAKIGKSIPLWVIADNQII